MPIDGTTLAVEALVRWRHAHWGWLAPDEFIPIAERNDLIVPLERYVLSEAAREARVWRDRYPGGQPITVFVNVSPQQLARSDFIRWFSKTVESHGLVATDIGIEVTERAFIDETDGILVENMNELARMGVQLSLDELSAIGVKRISVGSSLARAALGAFMRAAREMHDKGTFSYGADAALPKEMTAIFRTFEGKS